MKHRLHPALLVPFALAPAAFAQCELQLLTPFDGEFADHFGWSVATSGDRAVAGAYREDDGGNGAGAVYFYERAGTQWVLEQKLISSIENGNEELGWSSSMDGDRAAIGATNAHQPGKRPGAVVVYDRGPAGWAETAVLYNSDSENGDRLGWSVALEGDRIVAGAIFDDTACPTMPACDSGSAYVFEYDGAAWNEVSKLAPAGLDAVDYFGWSVAISGDRIAVGAERDDDLGSSAGAVYIYERTGPPSDPWVFSQKLTAAGGGQFENFGASVALEGDRLLVGSPSAEFGAPFAGSVRAFEDQGSGFVQVQEFTGSGIVSQDRFGFSLSMSGDRAVVGAFLDEGPFGFSLGSAHLFEHDGSGWVETTELVASGVGGGDRFGYSVSISGETILVGAPYDDDVGVNSGSAWVFTATGGGPPALGGLPASVSLATGGAQTLSLKTCPSNAGLPYLVLGSASGTAPGFPVDGLLLPLALPDAYFDFTLQNANGAALVNTFGLLDGNGEATAQVVVPTGLGAGLAGLVLNHAWIGFEVPGSGGAVVIGGPASLELAP